MKKNEVKVGESYRTKVSGSVVDVRITGENPHGGWEGVNALTNRKVRIKSAQRLRCKTSARPAKRKTITTLAEYEAEAKQANGKAAPAKKATKATAKARKTHAGERRDKGGKPDGKPMSLLDAAAHLLSLGTGDPMRCKDIVELAVARGLWTPGDGKTPSNTLYSSILREIKAKGDAARFRKIERGKFELAK